MKKRKDRDSLQSLPNKDRDSMMRLTFNAIAGTYAFVIIMLHFRHLRDQVGSLNELLRSIPAGHHNLDISRLIPDDVQHVFKRNQLEIMGGNYLVEDDDSIPAS